MEGVPHKVFGPLSRANKLILEHRFGLFLIALLSAQSSLLYAKAKVGASISAGIEYSDNIKLSPDNEEDSFALRVSPGFSIADSGAHTSYSVSYNFESITYAASDELDQTRHFLNSSLNRSFWDKRVGFDVGYNIDQFRTDSSSSSNPGGISGLNGYEETQTFNTGLTFNNLAHKYASIDMGINYDTVRPKDSDDSWRYGYNLRATQGHWFTKNFWSLSSQKNIFDADDSPQSLNTIHAGLISVNMTNKVFLLLKGNYEKVSLDEREIRGTVQSSFGPGLEWRPSSRSYINVAYNFIEEGDNEDFWSTAFQWTPSSRTFIQGRTETRFYGDSYFFKLEHKARKVINSIDYDEKLTNFNGYTNNQNNDLLGVLVCPTGNNYDLNDCTLPSSANFELQPGQQFVGAQVLPPTVSNELQLNKTFRTSSSYKNGKSTYLLGLSHQRRHSTDLSQSKETELGVNITWRVALSSRTSATASATLSKLKESSQTTAKIDNKHYDQNYRINLVRQLNPNTTVTAGYSFYTRNSKDNSGYDENSVFTTLTLRL